MFYFALLGLFFPADMAEFLKRQLNRGTVSLQLLAWKIQSLMAGEVGQQSGFEAGVTKRVTGSSITQ